MSEHLSELQIYAIAAGEGGADGATGHLRECAECAAALRETRGVLTTVEGLATGTTAPRHLELELERRLSARDRGALDARAGFQSGVLIRAAALLLIFAAGALAHATWSSVVGIGSSAGEAERPAAAPSPALTVQRAGTDYVASIARLVADTAISGAERHAGREVALAALSGALHELSLLPSGAALGEDPGPAVDRLRRRTTRVAAP